LIQVSNLRIEVSSRNTDVHRAKTLLPDLQIISEI
jgi:hypothetical protein